MRLLLWVVLVLRQCLYWRGWIRTWRLVYRCSMNHRILWLLWCKTWWWVRLRILRGMLVWRFVLLVFERHTNRNWRSFRRWGVEGRWEVFLWGLCWRWLIWICRWFQDDLRIFPWVCWWWRGSVWRVWISKLFVDFWWRWRRWVQRRGRGGWAHRWSCNPLSWSTLRIILWEWIN